MEATKASPSCSSPQVILLWTILSSHIKFMQKPTPAQRMLVEYYIVSVPHHHLCLSMNLQIKFDLAVYSPIADYNSHVPKLTPPPCAICHSYNLKSRLQLQIWRAGINENTFHTQTPQSLGTCLHWSISLFCLSCICLGMLKSSLIQKCFTRTE